MRISYFRVKNIQKVPSRREHFFPDEAFMGVKKSRILCRFQIWRIYSEKRYWKKDNPEKLFFSKNSPQSQKEVFLGSNFFQFIFFE
jgi:hypothetical protein